ncbi:MAG: peptidoglycan DD-metalloendopeptidase family protein [Lachnospiraceae bacterium]|nr:peptidoglycan DD-metalloendopeptidase family protein [Lachnospiraceae bacterium]
MIKKRSIKKTVCLISAVVLAFSWYIHTEEQVPVHGATYTNALIQEKQREIEEANAQRAELAGRVTDLNASQNRLASLRSDLNAYVTELDAELVVMQNNIAVLNEQIIAKEYEISQTEAELAAAEETEAIQHDAMIVRMRLMYEQGDKSMIDMLFSARSLRDLLNSADYIEKVVQYDRSLWEEYKANVEYISLCKQQLDLQKEILDEAKAAAELEEQNQETLINEKNAEINSYNVQINATQAEIDAYQAEIAARDAEIEALTKAIEEERRRLASANGLRYDGGQFLFPLASYKYVSSDYGPRNAPTAGASTFHKGIDFAAAYGTDIYAAYDGEVAAASYSGAMGNYIMIDHGDGLYTVYEHCSAMYVQKGDKVVMGQTIAAVGSTGISTGNHLHFGVRRNGEYTSPWPYLGK